MGIIRWFKEKFFSPESRWDLVPRSGQWSTVRKRYLESHPACEVCGSKKTLQVHHVRPFHLDMGLELEPTNLIALCGTCHFVFGHLSSWTSWNESVREDAAAWSQKIKNRSQG